MRVTTRTKLLLDQRATTANAMRPALFITIHAATEGRGAAVFTAQLPPTDNDRRSFLPWDSAQSAYLDQSSTAAGSIAAELTARQVPVRAMVASVRPLNNIAAAAIAIEIYPADGSLSTLTSADYQQRIAGAIASGVAAIKDKLGAAK